MDVLLDMIKYFAKFPDREGVLEGFSRSEASEFEEYAALKTYIEELPEPIMPAIKDFVFTGTDDVLRARIQNIPSYFMLIEWGPIAMAKPDHLKNRDGEWFFAVNIAHPSNDRNYDHIEKVLLANKCLNLLLELAGHIKDQDKKGCAECRFLDCEMAFSPIEPYGFFDCEGWSITFTKTFNNKF